MPYPFTFRAVGDLGLLIEFGEPKMRHRIVAWLDAHVQRPSMREVIPAATTVFVAASIDVLVALKSELLEVELPRQERLGTPTIVTVDVRYDGPDLAEVADRRGMTPAEVVDLHTSTAYPVEFFGFAPGQAYLGQLSPLLRLPRRRNPRVRVPAGAVAIANDFTIIYPEESPGGWNLIGTRVSAPLWDAARTPPNSVDIGDQVRFRACR
jgi:KipI family sensor histidine kinase inhibitor